MRDGTPACAICAACGAPAEVAKTGAVRRFCSDRCRCWARLHPGERRPFDRKCDRCGINIDHKQTSARFCSALCGDLESGRLKPTLPIKTCPVCGESFQPRSRDQRGCPGRCAASLSDRLKQLRRTERDPNWRAEEGRRYRSSRSVDVVLRQRALKVLAENRRRALLEKVLVIPFSRDQLLQRWSMFAGCWMCGATPTSTDHVKPLSRGGPHILANLRPACGPCNSRKRDRWAGDLDALKGSGSGR